MNRRNEEEETQVPEVIVPVNDLSPEMIKALREGAAKETFQALLRRAGCMDCPNIKKYNLTSVQVINRLAGRVPSYCCELEVEKLDGYTQGCQDSPVSRR